MGDLYLNIVESKNKDSGGFERQSVIVFAEDLPAFLGEFDKSLKVFEKAAREQKRSGKRRDERDSGHNKTAGHGEAAARDAKHRQAGGRRVVVKKREE
jgi:hypothetical protein